jgi:hypothetical protein
LPNLTVEIVLPITAPFGFFTMNRSAFAIEGKDRATTAAAKNTFLIFKFPLGENLKKVFPLRANVSRSPRAIVGNFS